MQLEDLVLLVDDDPVCQNIIKHSVEKLGYQFTGLLSGDQFMAVVVARKPALILIDVHLPDCSGFDLCSMLKAAEEVCQIPVLFLTMSSDPESIDEAFKRGAIDYITKPFRIEEVKSRIQAHIKLAGANQHLEKELAIKKKLFSLISHDLRSPFSSMIGVLSLLVQEYPGMADADRLEFLKALLENSNHHLQLLDNLMYWSRGQSDRIVAQPKPVSLSNLVQVVFQGLASLAAAKRVSLISRVADDVMVLMDPDLTQAMLRNLIHNAIKYSPEDRAVVVRSSLTEPLPGEDRLSLLVEDFGGGFPHPELGFIHDNFTSTPGTAGEKGAGIGLMICRTLADRQGARLELVRSDARGSVIAVNIPLATGN